VQDELSSVEELEEKSGEEPVAANHRGRTNLWIAIVLLGVVAAAAYLRLAQLGTPSFWVDELNFVYAAKSINAGEQPHLPSGNPNRRALLYSQSVALSFRLFGVNEFAARLPGAIFGILAVIAIFFVAKDLFGRNAGVLSAVLLAFSHITIGWSRTARMYTLFQLLFLIAVYLFYKGFEGTGKPRAGHESRSILSKLGCYLARQGVRWHWLVLSGIIALVSLQLHQLTGTFVASLLVYILGMFLVLLLTAKMSAVVSSKYALALAVAALAAVVAFVKFDLWRFIEYALEFHPAWARYDLVQDSHYYYYFLTESSQFPIAAFFLIGCVQMVTRADKKAFFVFCVFAVPVLAFSFVFAYRVPNYIFHIYPFYVMLAAYALNNLYVDESQRAESLLHKTRRFFSRRWVGIAWTCLILGWLPLTIWFRYAWKLPFMGQAGPNGAVRHFSWRDAASYVETRRQPGEVLVSSLPLTMYYYVGNVDYNLNNANLDELLDWQTANTSARRHDFYSGAEAISSLPELEQVLDQHSSAMFVMDTYRFERNQYVPGEISDFIKKNLQRVWVDEENTIQIFEWHRDGQMQHQE